MTTGPQEAPPPAEAGRDVSDIIAELRVLLGKEPPERRDGTSDAAPEAAAGREGAGREGAGKGREAGRFGSAGVSGGTAAGILRGLLPLVATGVLSCAATLYLVTAVTPAAPPPVGPQIALFDVDAAMARFIARPDIAALAPDDPAFADAVRGFHTGLMAGFASYAARENRLLLSASTVLGGSAPDATAALVDAALANLPTVQASLPATPPPAPAPAPSPAPAPGAGLLPPGAYAYPGQGGLGP